MPVRRERRGFLSGCESHPATFAPAGSNRGNCGGNEAVEAHDGKGRQSDSASGQAVTTVNAIEASKHAMREPTLLAWGEGRRHPEKKRLHPQGGS
jgi:hypothetical protein